MSRAKSSGTVCLGGPDGLLFQLCMGPQPLYNIIMYYLMMVSSSRSSRSSSSSSSNSSRSSSSSSSSSSNDTHYHNDDLAPAPAAPAAPALALAAPAHGGFLLRFGRVSASWPTEPSPDGFEPKRLYTGYGFSLINMFTLLDLCASSLRRGHANLLCLVPSLTDDPRRESWGIGSH